MELNIEKKEKIDELINNIFDEDKEKFLENIKFIEINEKYVNFGFSLRNNKKLQFNEKIIENTLKTLLTFGHSKEYIEKKRNEFIKKKKFQLEDEKIDNNNDNENENKNNDENNNDNNKKENNLFYLLNYINLNWEKKDYDKYKNLTIKIFDKIDNNIFSINWTLLHFCTFFNKIEFIKILLDFEKININDKDEYNNTPLNIAEKLNNEEIIKIFKKE
jgi:hypothetical protein